MNTSMPMIRSLTLALSFFCGSGPGFSQIVVDGKPNAGSADLVGWWDAADLASFDFENGSRVRAWVDRSAKGIVATVNPGARIERVPYFNGRYAVIFNGVDFLSLSQDLIFSSGDGGTLSAFVVARSATPAGGGSLLSMGGAEVLFFGMDGNAVHFSGAGGGGETVTYRDYIGRDAVRFVSLGSNTSGIRYAINGLPGWDSQLTGAGEVSWELNRIGGDEGCSENFRGQIAEVLFFDRALSGLEERQIGRYLATKYGIATLYPNQEVLPDEVVMIPNRVVPETGATLVLGSCPEGQEVGKLEISGMLDARFEFIAGTGDEDNFRYVLSGPDANCVETKAPLVQPASGVHSLRVRAFNESRSIEGIVAFEIQADADDDGLPDAWELRFGALGDFETGGDADQDLLFDEEEFRLGLDPRENDEDDDGSLDGEEIVNRTDPREPDSDSDGLSDGAEALAGADPLAEDSDGDGLLDGEEVHGDMASRYISSPILADTDGDGFDDRAESLAGTDPYDPANLPSWGGGVVEYGTLNPTFAFLNAWWDASDGSSFTWLEGGRVSTWRDKSLRRRVATVAGASVVFRDEFRNGRSKVAFSGPGFMAMSESVAIPLGASGSAGVFVVAKVGEQGTLLSLAEGGNQFFRSIDGGLVFQKEGLAAVTIVDDQGAQCRIRYFEFSAVDTQGITSYKVNGVPLAISNGGNLGGGDWVFDRMGGGDGEVAELIVFDRALTDDEEEEVGGYLSLKYGIPTTYPAPGAAGPEVISLERDGDGGICISWASFPGDFYTIQVSGDLDDWADLEDGYPSDGRTTEYRYPAGQVVLPDPARASRLFFRVVRE